MGSSHTGAIVEVFRASRWIRLGLCIAAMAGWACGVRVPARLPSSPPGIGLLGQPLTAPAPQVDLVQTTVESVEDRLAEAEAWLALGQVETARAALERALAELAEAPASVTNHPQVQAVGAAVSHRLVELGRRSGAPAPDLADQTEPAAIDAILDAATLLPAPEPALSDLVLATLARATPDLPVPVNDKVLSYVELFRTRLRDWFQDGLRRSGRYLSMIERVFRSEGLPLDLAYVALIESAFKPTALSRARAKGVWQFMRETARRHGLNEDWYLDERADPEKATRAAARYLKALVELFSGDWLLALASYNGGPGRVQRAIARSGARDFWSLAARPRLLPRETREYVPMVLAAIIIAKAPQVFGFSVEPDPPLVYESVPLAQPVDLRRVATWIGTSMAELLELNPELRRWATPAGHPGYRLKVPVGTADVLRARLATAPDEHLEPFDRHTVKRGETLASIARRLKVSRSELAAANHLSVRARVWAGQQLIIPRPPPLERAADGRPTATSAEIWRTTRRNDSGPPDSEPTRVVHRVKRGDTLVSIARRYGTTVEDLQRWNGLRTTRIVAGRELIVYTSRAVAAGLE